MLIKNFCSIISSSVLFLHIKAIFRPDKRIFFLKKGKKVLTHNFATALTETKTLNLSTPTTKLLPVSSFQNCELKQEQPYKPSQPSKPSKPSKPFNSLNHLNHINLLNPLNLLNLF